MHETHWVVLPADMPSWLDMIYLSWSNVLCFGGCFSNFFGGQWAVSCSNFGGNQVTHLSNTYCQQFLGCFFSLKVHIRRCFPTLIQYIVIGLVKGNLTSEIIIRMFPNSSFHCEIGSRKRLDDLFEVCNSTNIFFGHFGFGKVMLSSRVQIQYMFFLWN